MLVVAVISVDAYPFLVKKKNKSESKVKLRKANNCCDRVLEAAKLADATTKTRVHHVPETWLLGLANSVLNKGKSVIPSQFNGVEVLSSVSDKATLFAKNFSKNSNLDDSGISLLVFPSTTNFCNSQDG